MIYNSDTMKLPNKNFNNLNRLISKTNRPPNSVNLRNSRGNQFSKENTPLNNMAVRDLCIFLIKSEICYIIPQCRN